MTGAERNALGASRRRPLAGYEFFFPAATIYAIFALPESVLQIIGIASVFPGLASPAGHAYEMLFGFALAVVAGNQLGAVPIKRLALAFGLWTVSRITFLLAPHSLMAAAVNIAFLAVLATHLVPRLFKAVKKVRNQALPLVLTAICVSGIAFQVASYGGSIAAENTILTVAVLLFALLMLFMGGRILAPAVAGQFYRQGGNLDARVQPRIELALIVAMALTAAASAFAGESVFVALAAAAAIVAGLLAAVRLLRWRLWVLRGRPDLLCLGAGYGWLAIGLLLFGAALAADRQQITALHVITVGSIGTLTLNVMAMAWAAATRQDPARDRLRVWGTILIAGSTLARVLAGFGVYDARALLLLASVCWSGAFALLLASFVRARASTLYAG